MTNKEKVAQKILIMSDEEISVVQIFLAALKAEHKLISPTTDEKAS